MFSKNDIKDIRALTPMQRGMLHHALLEPASSAYHEQLILRFDGKLDPAKLERAWQQVVDHHDALRGRFLSERVSNPVQVIPHHEPISLAQHHLSDPKHAAGGDGLPAELEAFLAHDLAQGFDLAQTHPMRLALFSGDDCHWLVWSFHHILIDGWSIGLVLDQVLARYQGGSGAAAPCGYGAYQRWLAKRDRQAALAHWHKHLAGFDGGALLPRQGSDAMHQQAHADIDRATAAALRTLAQSQRASLHHLLLTAWALTAGRYLDQRDVIVPTVLAGRPAELEDAENLVGLLINTVPMRVSWQDGASFASLLQQVRDHSLEAATHQHLSMADIQAAGGKLPIDHLLLVQGMPHQDVIGAGCGDAAIGWAGFRESTPYGLEVALTPHDDGIAITLRGGCDVHWMQGLADSLRALLAAVAADPQRPLGDIELIDAAQRECLLVWGDGGPAPAHDTPLTAFDRQLADSPDAPALVSGGHTLSYRELDRRANRLAHTLLANGALPADTPVALVSNRDAGLLAGLLAILRAGAAYVPVDPDFPADRVRLMLEAGGCRHVLASSNLIAALPPLPGARILDLDAPAANVPDNVPDAAPNADDLAYVIFTSGSTGTPKGAMLRHRNAAAFFATLPKAFGFKAGDRILATTTVSFDIAALELLGALCCGMTVVLASAEQTREPAMLATLIERERVNVMQMTPTRLRMLLDALAASNAVLHNIDTLLVGGEALPESLAQQLLALPKTRVFNVYGPTETTIWSASWPLVQGRIHLGRALPGERLLLLSAQHKLQPPGAIGEIAIAGAGVARGYLNDPVRTAERFITLPGIDGPVYLTGDLGRWNADGSLDYLGRRDDQIKIRGMRIEIGDIEHHLRQLPDVQDAAAAIRKNAAGEPEIVAYLVLAPIQGEDRGGDALDVGALRTLLARSLPGAMLPSRFMALTTLPQTPNGKIDRRALPEPQQRVSQQPSRTAANALEDTLMGIFSDVIGHPIGPDDDFFLSGGHSLKAIQAIGRINRELGAGYTLRDLYRASTAASLASAGASRAVPPIARAPDAADYPLSHAQQALWVLDQMQPGYAGYNVPGAYLLRGTLDIDAFTHAWQTLVARHESLRTVFRTVNGEPRQIVLDKLDVAIDQVSIKREAPSSSAGEKGAGEDALAHHIADLTCRPFNLSTGPLFRIALIPLDAQRQILLLVTHHIISDGWSDAIIINDLAAAYRAALAEQDPHTALAAAPSIRYRDFAVWQHRHLASPLAQTHRDYWRDKLRDLPQLTLPTDRPRRHRISRSGARIDMRLNDIEAAAWLQAVPPGKRYATLAAATLALLHLESGQTDLVLGLPVANRDRAELQDQVGLHLNMLPLRQQPHTDASLAQLRDDCGKAIVEAMAHADYPFARLVDELGLGAGPGRHPVFDAMLIYHQQPVPVPQLEGVEVEVHDPQSYTSRFDLDFEVWTSDDSVHGFIEYDAELFSGERMARLVARWQDMLIAHARNEVAMLKEFRTDGTQDTADFLAQSLAVDDEF